MAAPKPLPSLKDHEWIHGMYKRSGASTNERRIPRKYVLSIIVAEACFYSAEKISNTQFTFSLRSHVPDNGKGIINLSDNAADNPEVREYLCVNMLVIMRLSVACGWSSVANGKILFVCFYLS